MYFEPLWRPALLSISAIPADTHLVISKSAIPASRVIHCCSLPRLGFSDFANNRRTRCSMTHFPVRLVSAMPEFATTPPGRHDMKTLCGFKQQTEVLLHGFLRSAKDAHEGMGQVQTCWWSSVCPLPGHHGGCSHCASGQRPSHVHRPGACDAVCPPYGRSCGAAAKETLQCYAPAQAETLWACRDTPSCESYK